MEGGQGRGQNSRTPHFQGSCEELKGWVFDSTDSCGTDKFDVVRDEIERYISIKFKYGMELTSSTNKLQVITLPKPLAPVKTADQLDKDINKEEVREYVREMKAHKRATKQAHALIWGQCLQLMREKLQTMNRCNTISDRENVVDPLKAIKSTVFRFDNKCDVYVAMGNIKYKYLIEVAEEHRANIGLHLELLSQEAENVNAPMEEKKKLQRERWNSYPNSIKQAYTMICERRNHGTPRVGTESQLAFHARGDGEEEDEEIFPLAGGSK
eukprot:5289900-Ditylum_brightwellii.AAC.1